MRFFLFIGSLSYKALAVINLLVSGVLGMFVGEKLTSQWGTAALAGVIAGIFTTALTVLPRIMEQRRKGRESADQTREAATAALIKRLTDFHVEKELFLQQRIAEKELIATLERNAKHDAVNEWGAADGMVKELQAMLREKGITPPPYRSKTYREIIGESDKKIEAVAQKRVEANGGPLVESAL